MSSYRVARKWHHLPFLYALTLQILTDYFFSFYQVVRPLGRNSVNKYLYLYLIFKIISLLVRISRKFVIILSLKVCF